MSIHERIWGISSKGEEIKMFTLVNSRGMKVEIAELGATITSMIVPNRLGKTVDVVLGFETVEDYELQNFYMGAIVGRCANRIERGRFKLNGTKYTLNLNNGKNHLHGGPGGFHTKKWVGEMKELNGVEWLEMTCHSGDGEEGYPGSLQVSVSYYLTDANSLEIEYFALSDRDTIVNLTSHPYFNLKGHHNGDTLDHKLELFSDYYTELNKELIANGKLREVQGTPMDFRTPKLIGADINEKFDQLKFGNGYDGNWVIRGADGKLRKCAVLTHEETGRSLEVQTTMPGIQLYTGNYLDNHLPGKGGAQYEKYSGVCLEAQFFPNSMAHENFPSIVLRAFEKYREKTVYRFR